MLCVHHEPHGLPPSLVGHYIGFHHPLGNNTRSGITCCNSGRVIIPIWAIIYLIKFALSGPFHHFRLPFFRWRTSPSEMPRAMRVELAMSGRISGPNPLQRKGDSKSSALQTPSAVLACFKNHGMLDGLGTRGASRSSDGCLTGVCNGVISVGFAAPNMAVIRVERCLTHQRRGRGSWSRLYRQSATSWTCERYTTIGRVKSLSIWRAIQCCLHVILIFWELLYSLLMKCRDKLQSLGPILWSKTVSIAKCFHHCNSMLCHHHHHADISSQCGFRSLRAPFPCQTVVGHWTGTSCIVID